ncbi:MAG: peptide chain release factor-like protein [Phycisphaeraceae bacterium]|nr:peptide chain release factor-like protein [Phycisphaeraceae bacterium]MCW5755113.1 peptide chain release factor-like protein [Phycisphaeraceae bacterium]
MMHPASLPDDDLLAECRVERLRTQGPGGQHRNKTETAVLLTHLPTGVQAQASERRSAGENMPFAVRRLRLLLAVEVRTAVPLGDARSDLWKRRCTQRKIVCSPRHRDYPALLAEALDMIDACRFDARKAAARLACTPTQLVRFVKDHPPALASWNAERLKRKLHALK